MENVVGTVVKSAGEGFGDALGKILISMIGIIIVGFLILGVTGFLALGLAWLFYKKRRPVLFLIFSLISALSFSVFGAILLVAWLGGKISAVFILAPIFFIGGAVLSFKKYKRCR